MPTMSDSRRKSIQRCQRKAMNARNRAAKLAKKERNRSVKSGRKHGPTAG